MEVIKLTQGVNEDKVVSQFEDLIHQLIELYAKVMVADTQTTRLTLFMQVLSQLAEMKDKNTHHIEDLKAQVTNIQN